MHQQVVLTPVPLNDIMAQVREIVRDELLQKQRADLSEKLLTPKQTAELLQVSLVTLWAWEKQGRVTKYTIGGRTYFKHGEIMQGLETLQRYRKPNRVGRAAAL